jgi:SAM-dependent methyltransferase
LACRARRVVATEVTEEAVRAVAESLEDMDNVEVRLLDLFAPTAEQPELSDQRFDLVLLSEVLEHLEDDVAALQQVRLLLRDNGILVITVPRDPQLWSVEDELWGHKRRYLRKELVDKLAAAGFRPTKVWTWGFPITKYLVLLQIWRLKRRIGAKQEDAVRPLGLPLPLLHVARAAFVLITGFEQLFKRIDQGVGYIAVAEPIGGPGSAGED